MTRLQSPAPRFHRFQLGRINFRGMNCEQRSLLQRLFRLRVPRANRPGHVIAEGLLDATAVRKSRMSCRSATVADSLPNVASPLLTLSTGELSTDCNSISPKHVALFTWLGADQKFIQWPSRIPRDDSIWFSKYVTHIYQELRTQALEWDVL